MRERPSNKPESAEEAHHGRVHIEYDHERCNLTKEVHGVEV